MPNRNYPTVGNDAYRDGWALAFGKKKHDCEVDGHVLETYNGEPDRCSVCEKDADEVRGTS